MCKVELDVPSYMQQAWDTYRERDVAEPEKLVAAVLAIYENTDWRKYDKVPAPPQGKTMESLHLSDLLTVEELKELELMDWVSDSKRPTA